MEVNKICVVGLGYVGLPLALALNKHFPVIGFDINEKRVNELKKGDDKLKETSSQELLNTTTEFSSEPSTIKSADFVIICVPTPIDQHKKPDLSYLKSASKTVAENLAGKAIVVYESTVYPGVTEEECVPILESNSQLDCGVDFWVGYSPERVNPGDKEHTINKVTKIIAGMDEASLTKINYVYSKITNTHCAPSIKVAEAAKIIENIQRDLNIALMNELRILFDKMNIDTKEVLKAAQTKWNFHSYSPGLVGGHCIPTDPYYLTYKAEELGYHPDVILAGRRINDNMHSFYVQKIVRMLNGRGISTKGAKVLILGLTFKANVKDYRNSRVKDLISELKEFGVDVYAYDPWIEDVVISEIFGANVFNINNSGLNDFEIVVLAVKHCVFNERLFKEEMEKIDQQKLMQIV